MFSIRRMGHNSYPNNIDIDKVRKDLTYYPGEQEVLLMPYFMFTVTAIKTPKEEGGITIIECQEIPF